MSHCEGCYSEGATVVIHPRPDCPGCGHEAELLAFASAIMNAAKLAGIYNGEVGLTGPHLLMLCADMGTEIARLRAHIETVEGDAVLWLSRFEDAARERYTLRTRLEEMTDERDRWVESFKECGQLRKEANDKLYAAETRLAKMEGYWKTHITDLYDDLCDAGCTTYGHEPECAATNAVAHIRKLKGQVERLREVGNLKRNSRWAKDKEFEGEWVVIPKVDFDALAEALATSQGQG